MLMVDKRRTKKLDRRVLGFGKSLSVDFLHNRKNQIFYAIGEKSQLRKYPYGAFWVTNIV